MLMLLCSHPCAASTSAGDDATVMVGAAGSGVDTGVGPAEKDDVSDQLPVLVSPSPLRLAAVVSPPPIFVSPAGTRRSTQPH